MVLIKQGLHIVAGCATFLKISNLLAVSSTAAACALVTVGKSSKKIIQRNASFQVVKQRLYRNPGSGKYWLAA
ncbi:hypothetical protein HNP98_002627 [Hymenobacter sp. 9A]|uniref:Secreted protein n=1 Tax=Hymenobacter caeli TaxID=2735894 RepID=A0ABX2FRI9_9BACT|nr:hypothetical protein [Hymenobacter caeli]